MIIFKFQQTRLNSLWITPALHHRISSKRHDLIQSAGHPNIPQTISLNCPIQITSDGRRFFDPIGMIKPKQLKLDCAVNYICMLIHAHIWSFQTDHNAANWTIRRMMYDRHKLLLTTSILLKHLSPY